MSEAGHELASGPSGIAAQRKLFYALIVLLSVWMLAEGLARLVLPDAANPRYGALGDVLVTAGFEQLQKILEPDPDRFWRVRAHLDAERLEGRLGNSGRIAFSVSTDGHGHRRTPQVGDARWDVVFLGDSCTFGVAVEDEETFASLLAKRIGGMRAINAGTPGYTAYQGRVSFETTAWERAPSAVVVSFMFNDDLPWDGRSDLEHAADRGGVVDAVIRRSRLLQALVRLRDRSIDASVARAEPRPRLNEDEYARELRRIVAAVRERGSEAILVAWPLARQMQNDRVTRKQLVMRTVANQLDVPFVDLVTHFREQAKPLFADAVHANAAGHRVVAETLEPILRGTLAR